MFLQIERGFSMNFGFFFFFNSIFLGIGLAMDAFSVSLANGLNENTMARKRMCMIAGVYAFFQFLMPMIGWICVHTVIQYFSKFETFIPWIALILLVFIGGKMILDSIKGDDEETSVKQLSFSLLLVQGIATAIDALSVGFTIADYVFIMALIASLIIAIVTFIICMTGLYIGKKAGTKLAGKAGILGGIILICIGLEIFIKGVLL